jgi:hypothetical protein
MLHYELGDKTIFAQVGAYEQDLLTLSGMGEAH